MKSFAFASCIAVLAVAPAAAADDSQTRWASVSRHVAADGIVLLKNEADALPLKAGTKVSIFGTNTLFKCGTGSAKVRTSYEIGLEEGLKLASLEVVGGGDSSEAGIVLVSRLSGEGRDNQDAAFDLRDDELAAINEAKRVSGKVIVAVNAGHPVNLKPLKESADVDAILYAWFPGQEGGAAYGDVLTGRTNPSARLVDTLAEKVSDWPSDGDFRKYPKVLEYSEGTDVGYRYFNKKAPEKIVYPFGFGLSYTTFEEEWGADGVASDAVECKVTNTGNRAGRHSVLYWEEGELSAYAKTRLLAPGESERLLLRPWRGAAPLAPEPVDDETEELLSKLTLEQKVNLCSAQPPAVPRGTGGLGNLPHDSIPNAQTADGPNGVRRSGCSTCYPSGAHLAQSFDDNLAYEMGVALGEEAKSLGVDILLGPGLNIHRHPMCGRNFEYFSEDTLVSGKMAAAYVRGVQSTGTAATIKHFACNSREWNRHRVDSRLDDKTLRRIYLKGFEIAVKEGRPRCVMTAYNSLNGKPCGESDYLVNGILRGEWGFGGVVMTDWRAESTIWRQINAGCDIYMPFGYPEKVELAIRKSMSGEVAPAALDASARRVLREAKKSHRYAKGDFGKVCTIASDRATVIPAKDSVCVSSTWSWYCEDPVEGWGHAALGKDPRKNDVFVQYELDVEKQGEYDVFIRACSDIKSSRFAYEYDGRLTESIAIPQSGEWKDFGPVRLTLKAGRSSLKVWFYAHKSLSAWKELGAKFTRLEIRPAGCKVMKGNGQ